MKKNNDINILDSRVYTDATHKNDNRMSESGRSMVEILGVLAVVGVLSVGGIAGYSYAIAKYKASTIMSELNLRAIPLSNVQTQSPAEANTPLTMEMGNTMKSGNEVSAEVSVNPEYFEITVADVEKQACELILQEYTTSAWIAVNGTLYENATAVCSEKENFMTFVYKNDLGERRNCAQKGFFSLDSYKCECAGGTYFDNTAKDCVCPGGTKWTGSECTESRCGDNEFESAIDGCVSCEDPNVYTISQDDKSIALCNACPNRVYSSDRSLCLPKNICIEGEEVLIPDGRCVKCPQSLSGYINSVQESVELCQKCPNMRPAFSNVICLRKDRCAENEFFGKVPGEDYSCHSCNTQQSVLVGYSGRVLPEDEASCLACGRTIFNDGEYSRCGKTICETGQFKGLDGQCYMCTEPKSIQIEQDDTTCAATACGRKVINKNNKYYCEVSTCSQTGDTKSTLLSDGSCYPCDYEQNFKSSADECAVCGDLRRMGNSCQLNNCELGKSFPYAGGAKLCYKCDIAGYNGDGGASCGKSEYSKIYCEACGNYWTPQGNCYMPNSCNRGSEFRASINLYKFCTSCDYTEKTKMDDHEEHRKMCADCVTTPRFFADNYCYRCDSSESPVVTTAEERASCTKCPNRQINAEGKCELIKTED